MQIEVRDVVPQTPVGLVCSCCGCVISTILIILFFPCTVKELGQFKYGLVQNKITGHVDLENPRSPGRYWIGFWKGFIFFPSTLETIEFSDEKPETGVQHLSVLRSRDKDGKKIFLDISIQYLMPKENIGKIYMQMKDKYEDVFISELRDALSKAGNEFRIAETWENYSHVTNQMFDRCKTRLAQRHAVCWGLQLWRVRLDDAYEQALIRTQVRKQAFRTEEAKLRNSLVRAETQVELATDRKKITMIEAGGTASVHRITEKAKAEAEALLISAEASIVDLIRDTVLVNTSTGVQQMNASQIIKYRKLMLMTAHHDTTFLYKPFDMGAGDVSSQETINSQRLMAATPWGHSAK
eukprot:TRINITY_DN5914_c0_g1_i3.p1 TRINITY_DN5914_c0_g1~~TRINITY_DN5914_c0_g1_i3.p1  ORF type:complete len:373 (+),score=64.87 TRINITY_DN5914_c0_g1_i3:62-1120(+)